MAHAPSAPPVTTYLRWKAGEPRLSRLFDAPPHDDEDADRGCPGCDLRLAGEGPVRLVVLGPSDSEDQHDHQAGKWYSALAVIVHASCAQGVDADVTASIPDTVQGVRALLDRWSGTPA